LARQNFAVHIHQKVQQVHKNLIVICFMIQRNWLTETLPEIALSAYLFLAARFFLLAMFFAGWHGGLNLLPPPKSMSSFLAHPL
jgi:hypothetical protein